MHSFRYQGLAAGSNKATFAYNMEAWLSKTLFISRCGNLLCGRNGGGKAFSPYIESF